MLSGRCLGRRRDVWNVVYCEDLPPSASSFSWCAGSSEVLADGSTRREHACQDVWERRSHVVLSVRRRPPRAPSLPGVQGEVLRVNSLLKALNTCGFWRLCGTSCVMKICRRESAAVCAIVGVASRNALKESFAEGSAQKVYTCDGLVH